MIDVAINSDLDRFKIDEAKIRLLANKVLIHLGKSDQELSIQFSNTQEMADLNSQYRDKDGSTDVLSFPQQEFDSPVLVNETPESDGEEGSYPGLQGTLGDIVLSLDDALRNAKSIGHSLDAEVAFLIIHGILHLCGHDHQTVEEEKVMVSQQKILVELLREGQNGSLWAGCVVSS